MAGAVKHAQRSHKTRNKNYSEFKRFTMKAVRAGDTKKMLNHDMTILDRIKGLFSRKHQDR